MAAHENLGTQFTRERDPDYRYETHYQASPASGDPEWPNWVRSGVDLTVRSHRAENAYAFGTFQGGQPSDRFKFASEVAERLRPEHGYSSRMAQMLMDVGSEDVARGQGKDRMRLTDQQGDVFGSLGDQASRDLQQGMGEKGGQMKLFGSAHQPATATVDLMRSSQRARIHAPTLLAIADRDARAEFGVGLTASTNRSEYSEALTQHLGQRLGQQMTPRENRNASKFSSDYLARPREDFAGEEIPAHEVATARGSVRALARRPKQPLPHEQGTLF